MIEIGQKVILNYVLYGMTKKKCLIKSIPDIKTDCCWFQCVLTFPARLRPSDPLNTRCDSVMELMEKGVLRPGQGNLTLTIKVTLKKKKL